MKPSNAALLAALLLVPFASSRAQTPGDAEHQVLALVQRFTDAQTSFDVSALRDLTADDYVEVSPVGDVDPRAKMLGFYAPENKMTGVTVTLSEPQVRLFADDTAIVIEKLTYILPGPNNIPRTNEMRGTFVARKTPTGWKLISTQFTGLRSAKPTPTPPQ
jgi:uncharacterized protein (TIGR02246 family)